MSPDRHARTMLPIPDRPAPGLTTYDAKDPDTAFPPIEPLLPPAGAPNVLIVLIDDVGFGASSAFGGPCQTPNFERLADNGLRAQTDATMMAEMLAWSRSRGIYAGISLQGATLREDGGENKELYGKELPNREIVKGVTSVPTVAEGFIKALGKY